MIEGRRLVYLDYEELTDMFRRISKSTAKYFKFYED
jgi:hypothetical protein